MKRMDTCQARPKPLREAGWLPWDLKPFADCWGISSPLQNKPFETIFSCCWCFNLWVAFINLSDWHESSWPHDSWGEMKKPGVPQPCFKGPTKTWTYQAEMQENSWLLSVLGWKALEKIGMTYIHLYKPCISRYFLIFYNMIYKVLPGYYNNKQMNIRKSQQLKLNWSPQ